MNLETVNKYGDLITQMQRDDSLKYDPSNRIVWGRGSLEPRVLFIGEAPGRNEDEQGLPFVGRSGQLLNQWIEKLGLDTNDCGVINIVKCRPPNNRTPTNDEMEYHGQYTLQQIKLLNPETVILLGATAFKFFFEELPSFLQQVGKSFLHPKYRGTYFYPLPHPAYILRNSNYDIDSVLLKIKEELQ